MDLRTLKIIKNTLEGKLLAAREEEKKGLQKAIKIIEDQIEYLEAPIEIDGNIIQTEEELSEIRGF